MYKSGIGVEVNINQAIMWYHEAANKGDEESQHNLAEILSGVVEYEGVESNPTKARFYYRRAASQGCTKSM